MERKEGRKEGRIEGRKGGMKGERNGKKGRQSKGITGRKKGGERKEFICM